MFNSYFPPKTLSAKRVKSLQNRFPNIDTSVTLEDIDRAIYEIESYLDTKKYATDREQMLLLIRRLNKVRRPNG